MSAVIRSPQQVARLFEEFAVSKVPVATFARRHAIAPSRLRALFRQHHGARFAEVTQARQARPARRYAGGRRFEYQVRDQLRAAGWWAVRAAGSKGAADLVAGCRGQWLLVQCKAHGALSPAERAQVRAAASLAGAQPVLADREPGRATGLRLRLVLADGYLPYTLPPLGDPA